jgi:hypothetical protein
MVAKVGEEAGWFDLTAKNVPNLLIERLGIRGIKFLIPRETPSTSLLESLLLPFDGR